MRDRSLARQIAQQHFDVANPTAWFDVLYRQAAGDSTLIPWADGEPNPGLREWLAREQPRRGRAIVVGCGLGEDAEGLAAYGFDVTAFDISPSAIEWAQRNWTGSRVQYRVADLFNAPQEWNGAFDFVFECYTVQALPPEHRARTVACVANFVAPGGQLLVLARGRNEEEAPGDLPWPLTERELRLFETHGLRMVQLEDYMDREDPPVRRWRALLERTME
jgi:SAM-dependent methyltransferase